MGSEEGRLSGERQQGDEPY
uniref:Uncharacterized protein n=1 Tax=Anguilla anguilla TaxID=7936 RepID=A0A0E9SSS7_ANGAN